MNKMISDNKTPKSDNQRNETREDIRPSSFNGYEYYSTKSGERKIRKTTPAPAQAQHSSKPIIEDETSPGYDYDTNPFPFPGDRGPQPSQLPWYIADNQILSEKLNDYGNFNVVSIARDEELTPQDRENMKLIVRACNNAQRLADALQTLFRECAMVHKYWGENCNQTQADAAVTKASEALAEWSKSI